MPDPNTPAPKEQKPNQMTDLPPKQDGADAGDATDKVKGGVTGPCDRPKRQN
jgi:hypothetical protein